MKRKLLSLLVLLMMAVTGAWADEQVFYTLDGTKTASNTAYANAGMVNQGGITWMVTGNVNQNPWRIGGKDLSGVDRPVWSENSLDETVTKVTLEFGEANSITVNSITMTVAGDADFNNAIDSKAVNFSANNTVDVTPTEGKEWKNAYYRFVFNVSVTGSSNKYLQLKSIKFYYDPVVNLTANSDGAATPSYWATYYNGTQGYTADANTTVYKAALNGSSSLTLTAVDDIPAGQAVILKSTSSTITLTPAASTSADMTGNVLLGGTSVTSGYDAYTLSRGSAGTGTVGFYKFNGASLNGSKAHLEILSSSPAPARGFIGFGDDGTTAIDAPTATVIVEDSEIYDLTGRRIEGQPTRKGIYVKNGQKYIVK